MFTHSKMQAALNINLCQLEKCPKELKKSKDKSEAMKKEIMKLFVKVANNKLTADEFKKKVTVLVTKSMKSAETIDTVQCSLVHCHKEYNAAIKLISQQSGVQVDVDKLKSATDYIKFLTEAIAAIMTKTQK